MESSVGKASKKTSVVMRNWQLYIYHECYNLSGDADYHPRLGRNVFVGQTSEVVDYKLEKDVLIYETRNTIYHCPLKYMTQRPYANVVPEYKRELAHRGEDEDGGNVLDRIIAATAKLALERDSEQEVAFLNAVQGVGKKCSFPSGTGTFVFSGDAFLQHIKQLQEIGQKEIAEREAEEDARLIAIAEQYGDCVYMELSNIDNGNKLAYSLDGYTGTISPSVHIGMMQDSVLYQKMSDVRVDFRYFPRWEGIEIYAWSDNIKQAVIKNDTEEQICFNGVAIPAGETMVFVRGSENGGKCRMW